jgi:hypothetical protein
MLTKARPHISRALTGCWVVLWLTGSLSVAQGNLLPQWNMPHCPSGQAQHSQHNHNHCVWHCGGIDAQGTSERGGISADGLSLRVWALGAVPQQYAVIDAEVMLRGPPRLSM